ncbi:MAG TPA: hypothetical protein VI282_00240, partial [Verrucomicrobiae bacterium]
MNAAFPKMARVRQDFPVSADLDIRAALQKEFAPILPRLKKGATVAIGAGSRGISNIAEIVRAVVEILRGAGAKPFIFPAMGSHGGATPEGQTEVLASYGITESSMGAPIRAAMEVREIGIAECGARVFGSVAALEADHIILVNRIKPHTDFFGSLGSGLVKMSVIGLGKKIGAESMHGAASRLGHERVIRGMARVALTKAPVLCGVAILEDQRHQTAAIEVIPAQEIEAREGPLLERARELMPRLPFEEIDLLIVDRIGKNISGAGLDPNVIGRGVNGYLSSLAREGRSAPFIRRIFVRDLTPETQGNGIGIGMADITTARLVKGIDLRITYTNALTALTPQGAKIPIYFETDRECRS